MLHALINGKAGTTDNHIEPNTSWRQVFRANEDFLTSSVLGRLRYLPSDLMWSILRSVTRPTGILPTIPGQLRSLEFWPRYETQNDRRTYIEPDAVFVFDQITIIIEAKRWDRPSQCAIQWANEWHAVTRAAARNISNPDHQFILVGLGGFLRGANDDSHFQDFCNLVDEELSTFPTSSSFPSFTGARIDWHDLSEHIRQLSEPPPSSAILDDISAALQLAGYRKLSSIDDLAELFQSPIIHGAVEAIDKIWGSASRQG